ncbi:MAG: glycosyltransferase family 4 protein [Planctomycetota bacterium]|nr:glycosyltransferase family 4 protein [Planctomycetota bacterium]
MRIAMLCSGHPVTDERVTHKQAVSLARAGHEVIVFGRGTDGPTTLSGVALVPLAPAGGGLGSRARMIRPLARMTADWKPDVVTCHEPESALAGLRVKRRIGALVIFDAHEMFHLSLASRMPPGLGALVRIGARAILRYVARRVDWVTVVSPANQAFYRAARGDDRVDIIHNSPIVESFPPCRQDVPGPITLCHDGFLDRGRGMLQILEALALARKSVEARLLVVGKVPPADEGLFRQKIEDLHLHEAIELPGWVSYEKVGQILSRGQIGIVAMQPTPNNYLSLSNKIYNYMCCAQAVIVPRGSATADLVRDADCGLAVDTTRPEEIAEAIVMLVEDLALRRRLGTNGRKAIEETYGWHMMEKRLIEIYAQLK